MSEFPTTTPGSVHAYETGFAPASAAATAQSFADKAGDTPEAIRAYAEKAIAQLRETYSQSRQSLDEATRALEVSLDHASKGSSEFNAKLVEMTQRNLNACFDFARKLAGARTQSEAIELQTAFMRQQMDVLKAQAEEIQQLSARIATDASQPFQQQFSRTVSRYASNV